ncbi:uncharacterized protein IWZ02DRAFT_494525 [Phyllosticta citriasiana]|uniref:uncharacterized protein n=1 Tax=Phyllosticta citriasiana TaxID=595635 RepID=UPI0030FDA113
MEGKDGIVPDGMVETPVGMLKLEELMPGVVPEGSKETPPELDALPLTDAPVGRHVDADVEGRVSSVLGCLLNRELGKGDAVDGPVGERLGDPEGSPLVGTELPVEERPPDGAGPPVDEGLAPEGTNPPDDDAPGTVPLGPVPVEVATPEGAIVPEDAEAPVPDIDVFAPGGTEAPEVRVENEDGAVCVANDEVDPDPDPDPEKEKDAVFVPVVLVGFSPPGPIDKPIETPAEMFGSEMLGREILGSEMLGREIVGNAWERNQRAA